MSLAALGHRLWEGVVFWWIVLFTPRSVRDIEPDRVVENTPRLPPEEEVEREHRALDAFRERREQIERENDRTRELARLLQRHRSRTQYPTTPSERSEPSEAPNGPV